MSVVLLNSDYTTLGIISWRKAVRLMVKKKVEIVKASTRVIHNFEQTVEIVIPLVLRLIKLVRALWKVRVPFNKKALLMRDNHKCQYCGCELNRNATIDHVIPRSKGGKSTFDNCVAACTPCNNKKDDRLPSIAKMYPKQKPHTPTINEFIMLSIKNAGLDALLAELGIV